MVTKTKGEIIMLGKNKAKKLIASMGWYPGEDFKLFELTLFEYMPDFCALYIINIQIIKFMITFGFDCGD